MGYSFELSPEAEEDLDKLDRAVAKRVIEKIQWFASQSDPLHFATILKNSRIGDIRFRIGDYRAIAVIDASTQRIVIAAIGHRRDIYRN